MDQDKDGAHIEMLQAETAETSVENSFCDRMKGYEYRMKMLHSLWIGAALFSLGVNESQGGPTFLDLQIITDTTVEQASLFFTAHSIGYLLGSALSGILFKRVNANLIMSLGLVSMGTVAMATPYNSSYPLMIFMRAISGVFGGLVDSTANAINFRIWGNDGRVMIQILHFMFALGGVVSPFITEPFLAEKIKSSDLKLPVVSSVRGSFNLHLNGTAFGNSSLIRLNETLQEFGNDTHTTAPYLLPPRTTDVHYAFLITCAICCTVSLPFFVMFLQNICFLKKMTMSEVVESHTNHRTLPKWLHVLAVAWLCLFFTMYCCVEDTFGAYLMTFVVKQFDEVSKSRGAYITAAYWAAFAISRFLSIFLSKCLSPVHLLFTFTILMIISFFGFTISASRSVVNAVIVFTATAGLSMSAVFPAGLSWAQSELIPVTGRVTSCIFSASSIGVMLNPLLLGHLMGGYSTMWFCYVLLVQVLITNAVIIGLLFFNRRHLNIRYGYLYTAHSISVVQ